jgi:hypothetical protein
VAERRLRGRKRFEIEAKACYRIPFVDERKSKSINVTADLVHKFCVRACGAPWDEKNREWEEDVPEIGMGTPLVGEMQPSLNLNLQKSCAAVET